MKKLSLSVLMVVFMVSFLMVSPNLKGSAWAEGIAVAHGNSGHIEYLDRVLGDRYFLGWGLDFDQSSGLVNWIHYSIPVPVTSTVRYLGIKFATGSVDVSLTDFHVYNGRTKIYDSPDVSLSGTTYRDSWYIIDMGSGQTINTALGLSIEVGAGVESMSHNIEIYAVAAGWN